MSTAGAIIKTLRPRQWVKNSFVVAPLVFSKHLFDIDFALQSAAAAAAFCGLSGAVYCFNDLRDVDEDRRHPVKKNRPIASGALPESTALVVAIALAVVSLAGCALLSLPLAGVGAGYLAINLAYSLHLKQIAWLDVSLIAAGFLLRVIGGGLAIDVPPSVWLLACTALLSMLLGFGKRAHELKISGDAGSGRATTRAALAGYSLPVLTGSMVVLGLATCTTYALYTRDPHTLEYFGSRNLVWTTPFCVLGIARFMQLALVSPRLSSPTDAMLRDAPFLVNLLAWAGTVLAIIYSRVAQ